MLLNSLTMRIVAYTPSLLHVWNDFVRSSRNATFLHQRGFMDYHADRFRDASLLLYDDHNRLIALLPATVSGSCVSSHAGLTYGGWILGESKPDVVQMLDGWRLMLDYYKASGCDTLIYKPVPHIYHRYPAEEDLYALYRYGAEVDSVLISSVLDLMNPLPFNDGARRHLKKAERAGVSVVISEDFASFWELLSQRLDKRYGVLPVHSLDEIELLRSRFPENIHLWVVSDDRGEFLAGTVLFLCGGVVKAQYIASNEQGRAINAVDYLFSYIIKEAMASGYRYLDLGPSCEDYGRRLNTGLIHQKCGYGARGIAYTTYRMNF